MTAREAAPKWGSKILIILPVAVVFNPLVLGTVMSLQVRPIDSLFVAGVALAAGARATKRQRSVAIVLMAAMTVIAGTALLGNWSVESHATDWSRLARLMQGLAWSFIATMLISSPEQFRRLATSVALGGAVIAGISTSVFLQDKSLHRIAGLWVAGDGTSTAVQYSFNEVAAIHALAGALALAIFLDGGDETPIQRVFIAALVVSNFVGCLLTQSRSGLAALVAGSLVAAVTGLRGQAISLRALSWLGGRILLVAVGLASLTAWLTPQLALNRIGRTFLLGTHEHFSAVSRVEAWETGLEAWLASASSFLLGNGNKAFGTIIKASTAENFWIDRAVGGGLLTLAVCLALYASPGLWALRGIGGRDDRLRTSAALVVTAVVGTVGFSGNVVADPGFAAMSLSILYGAFGASACARTANAVPQVPRYSLTIFSATRRRGAPRVAVGASARETRQAGLRGLA